MTCICLQRFYKKMHKCYLKTTNVKLVQNFSQCSSPIQQLPMLIINKHGIRKINRNVLNMTSSVLQNLNIKSLIKSSQKHYQSQKDVKFPPAPPSAELCQSIVSNF